MGSKPRGVENFKAKMREIFEMSDLGMLSYYLGIEVKQRSYSITLNQAGYAEKMLEKLGLAECKPCRVPMDIRVKLSKSDGSPPVDATLYKSAIGSLRYLVNPRPDLTYPVGIVSRFMEAPTTKHLAAIKQILRYVKGTLHNGCIYNKVEEEEFKLVGYNDSDLAGDVDDRKSTTGVIYFLGQSPITWISQKQKFVALSSCKAEYIAATTGAFQGIWISRLLHELIGWKTNKFIDQA
ncbi:secreted RxLR effector protein 161-like [Manihot esculenta]|uniref:secreted RxLR effector protein 161-like n=1 Tax=Manihot esculenta TaxID=3983 RepID=UPI000B5D8EFA|nr:secreted RxLR effector protein 161-like [Manihot esculenta]